jgi:hypothetical protein
MNSDDNQSNYPMHRVMASQPTRMWINQPSTLQEHHKLHGQNVLTVPPIIHPANGRGDYIEVFFTEGDVISMNFPVLALSPGWKD